MKRNKLDLLIGNTLVFATNKCNETKEPIVSVEHTEELIHIPDEIQALVMAHYLASGYEPESVGKVDTNASHTQSSKLGLVAEKAKDSTRDMLRLLNIITPKHWKEILNTSDFDLPENHPDRLPEEESAHMYLVSLANVLRVDPSVSQDTYAELVFEINTMFSSPLDVDRVGTIVQSDLGSFVYNPKWKTSLLTLHTNEDELIEVFKVVINSSVSYLVFNSTTNDIKVLNSASDVNAFLLSKTGEKIKKDELDLKAANIEIIDTPIEPFGHDSFNHTFNMYMWNESQNVLYNPTSYADTYKTPTVTLKAMESAVGEQLYTHWLPFLRRKLMTREHSPLFFVFHGVPHSFKSAMFRGILAPLSKGRNISIEAETATEKYNDWIVNKDFIFLDEAHHIMSGDLRKIVKMINTIGGTEVLTGIRAMRESMSSTEYQNYATFIIATNEEIKLTTEVGERRMVVFSSNTKLSEALGMTDEAIKHKIIGEQLDFAYYLATEVQNISSKDYIHNSGWKNKAYDEMQVTAQDTVTQLSELLDKDNYEGMAEYISFNFPRTHISNYLTIDGRGKAKLRLFNNDPQKASVPGLFDDLLDVDAVRAIKSRVNKMSTPDISNRKTRDMVDGNWTGNRKQEWLLRPGTEVREVEAIEE